jgi:class 3 adenylate cyclase
VSEVATGASPAGTVTFLFTDIEGSTRLWQEDEALMRKAVARHDQLLRAAVADHGGVVFSTMGDGLAAAFQTASAAVSCAVEAQRLLDQEAWDTVRPIKVRMGVHTGEVERRDGDYFGTAVNRAARLAAVGHGGQIICSSATAELADTEVAPVDLGEHRLRDLDRPMHVFQIGDGAFPPLRSLSVFPGNLPTQLTSFVGRQEELASLATALEAFRLVTLTGTGESARPGWPSRRPPLWSRPSPRGCGCASWPPRPIPSRCLRWSPRRLATCRPRGRT